MQERNNYDHPHGAMGRSLAFYEGGAVPLGKLVIKRLRIDRDAEFITLVC